MKTFIKYICFVLILAGSNHQIFAQVQSSCANSDFSTGTFTNWTGFTSVYPYNTPGTNIGTPQAPYPSPAYYYKQGIVPGRHTIITQATADPFTCGTLLTLPPNEKSCVRLGNGGIGPWGDGVRWQRDYINYTFDITPSNALLIYKYAVILQDPSPKHAKEIRPRFIVSIRDQNGKLIDPVCGIKEDFADSTVAGYRNCAQSEVEKLGGKFESEGDVVYRAWTTVGVDLRKFIGTKITIGFETWDCGLGGHFGYAYLMARCDSLGILTAACSANGSVRLTAPDGFAYLWDYQNKTTRTIDIDNAKPGQVVTVELTTVSGCKTTLSTTIYPMYTKAVFNQSADSICLNVPVNFVDSSYSIFTNNNSKVPIIEWNWDFGDGSTANTQQTSHAYTKAGVYTVTLTVKNKNGCEDITTRKVKVFPAPVANFYVDDICKNGTATFTDASTKIGGGVVTKGWNWTFKDDNTTSTLQNPTHVYLKDGSYQVTLTVSDLGCSDDTTITIKVYPLPIADYVISEVCVGSPTSFNDKSTQTDNTDNIYRWIWNFGDKSALSSMQSPTHTYSKEGTYTTTLIVTTKQGCVGTATKDVIVRPRPTAKFTATPLCLSEPVKFTDKSTVPDPQAGDAIVEWYWSYKDRKDGHSTLQNPTNLYDTSSVYYPTLVVKSRFGCIDSTKIALNLPPLPFVNFDADKYENCVPLDVNMLDFSFSSSDKIKTWEWDFGDNSQKDTARNPHHTYGIPGTYDVSLTVSTANGCKAAFVWKQMMKVYPIPVADFIFTPEQPTESENTVTFYDRATDAVFWSWDFGDAGLSPVSVSIDQNPIHKFPGSGTFTIWQYVTSEHGCRDSVPKDITIKPDWTFYVPNTFTPNKDGTNDGFIPKGHNIIEFQMWIFDRWGNMIYTTDKKKDPASSTPWDGKANGGHRMAQEDVYVWLVELKDINNLPHRYIGHVTLVK
ncbi:MAG TPA: PKD domain-containing protein [Bacteroidia bacterium]|nr:PKD domain-containing protein [Bacteroidia bacterium]